MTSLLHQLNAVTVWAAILAVLPRVMTAIGALVAFWLLHRAASPLLRRALLRAQFDTGLVDLLVGGLVKGTLVVLAFITAASQLGVNVGAALASIGVVGIAVGFAAQETVANMIAGFLVFWDRPFKIGDYIATQDRYGRVTEITMRTTRIRTMENTFVVIPNKQITGDMLVNHSMYGATRINVPVGIAYKESISAARDVLLPAVRAIPGVLTDPAPDVVAAGLGASSVDLSVRVWISDAAIERPTFFRVVEASKHALDAAGIEIPFPQVQVSFDDIGGAVLQRLQSLTTATKT